MYLKIPAAHSILNLDPFLMQQLRARSPRRPSITSPHPRARFANGPATPGCPRTRMHSPLAPRSAPIHARTRAAAGGARAGAALGINTTRNLGALEGTRSAIGCKRHTGLVRFNTTGKVHASGIRFRHGGWQPSGPAGATVGSSS